MVSHKPSFSIEMCVVGRLGLDPQLLSVEGLIIKALEKYLPCCQE